MHAARGLLKSYSFRPGGTSQDQQLQGRRRRPTSHAGRRNASGHSICHGWRSAVGVAGAHVGGSHDPCGARSGTRRLVARRRFNPPDADARRRRRRIDRRPLSQAGRAIGCAERCECASFVPLELSCCFSLRRRSTSWRIASAAVLRSGHRTRWAGTEPTSASPCPHSLRVPISSCPQSAAASSPGHPKPRRRSRPVMCYLLEPSARWMSIPEPTAGL